MSVEDGIRYRNFLEHGSSAGLTESELKGIAKVNEDLALKKVYPEEIIKLRKKEILKLEEINKKHYYNQAINKFEEGCITEKIDAQKVKEFKETLDQYAEQSVNNTACKSEIDFYKMYTSREYKYSESFIKKLKKAFLDTGASSIINPKDVERAFDNFHTVGRDDAGNFATSMIEDNKLLYSDGKLVDRQTIAKIKGVEPDKYKKGVFQYSYDTELVRSAEEKGLINVANGTTPGSSILNIPGGKTWAGNNINYSESELLMPTIDVSKYSFQDVKKAIRTQGYFEIKNPTIKTLDGIYIQINGTFRINKLN